MASPGAAPLVKAGAAPVASSYRVERFRQRVSLAVMAEQTNPSAAGICFRRSSFLAP